MNKLTPHHLAKATQQQPTFSNIIERYTRIHKSCEELKLKLIQLNSDYIGSSFPNSSSEDYDINPDISILEHLKMLADAITENLNSIEFNITTLNEHK